MTNRLGYSAAAYSSSTIQAAFFDVVTATEVPHHLYIGVHFSGARTRFYPLARCRHGLAQPFAKVRLGWSLLKAWSILSSYRQASHSRNA